MSYKKIHESQFVLDDNDKKIATLAQFLKIIYGQGIKFYLNNFIIKNNKNVKIANLTEIDAWEHSFGGADYSELYVLNNQINEVLHWDEQKICTWLAWTANYSPFEDPSIAKKFLMKLRAWAAAKLTEKEKIRFQDDPVKAKKYGELAALKHFLAWEYARYQAAGQVRNDREIWQNFFAAHYLGPTELLALQLSRLLKKSPTELAEFAKIWAEFNLAPDQAASWFAAMQDFFEKKVEEYVIS